MLGRIRNSGVDVPRVAVVALLVMVAAIGVRARFSLSAKPPRVSAAFFGDFAAAVGAAEALAAFACLALLVVVFRGRSRRRRDNQQQVQELAPHSRASRLLALLCSPSCPCRSRPWFPTRTHGPPERHPAQRQPTDAGGWLAPLSAWSGKVTSLVGDEARLNRHCG
jgi:hypothetical protein